MADKQETKATEVKTEVKMIAADTPKTEMVKVKCLQPFYNPRTKRTANPGELVEVTKDEAAELTKDNWGSYAFRGERFNHDGDVKRHNLKRAELVAA